MDVSKVGRDDETAFGRGQAIGSSFDGFLTIFLRMKVGPGLAAFLTPSPYSSEQSILREVTGSSNSSSSKLGRLALGFLPKVSPLFLASRMKSYLRSSSRRALWKSGFWVRSEWRRLRSMPRAEADTFSECLW